VGKASLMDKVIGKAEKVGFLHRLLFLFPDTMVCRSSEKLLRTLRCTKLVSSVRRVGSRQLLVKPVRRMARNLTPIFPPYCIDVIIVDIVLRT
jgi:hypothetical protein